MTGPLRMRDTGYNPGPAQAAPDRRDRVPAVRRRRGMVWGEVHDENAWALDGVAGHAGLFSTAADLAILCQMLLNGGEYRGARILSEAPVRHDAGQLQRGMRAYPESDRGLGFELNKHWYMGALASPVTFGHTGFTGTSIVIDPLAHTFLIVLSNRVHPDRGWGTNTVARRALARDARRRAAGAAAARRHRLARGRPRRRQRHPHRAAASRRRPRRRGVPTLVRHRAALRRAARPGFGRRWSDLGAGRR